MRAEAVEKIRAHIDAIVLTPEEDRLRVDLTRVLAGILSFRPVAEGV